MKRNLLTILILGLVITNLIFSIIIVISVVPAMTKTNKLVTQISTAIDLELTSTTAEEASASEVTIEDLQVYDIADELTITLKKGEDGKEHYAVMLVSLSLNTTDPDFETFGVTAVEEKESLIKDKINTIVSSYTYDEINADKEAVREKILEGIQEMFESKYINEVVFRKVLTQ